MKLKRLVALFLVPVASFARAEVPSVEASEPRAFGWHVGDLIERRVEVFVPEGWRLDEGSLPRPGGRGQAIEVRRVERQDRAAEGGRVVRLDIEYQVLLSPASVRTIEIAPHRLKLEGAGRGEEVRIEAAPITVGPLVPADVSPRRGLGEMQPDHAPPLVDERRWRWRLSAWGLLATLIGSGLFALHVGVPWAAARRRPFGQAWRALRGLGAQPSAAEWRAACRRVHMALDHAAGEVLFEAGVARFVAGRPRFEPLGADIARFLALSRREFFGPGGHEAGDAAWLLGLLRRLRDAERGGP